MEAEDPVFMNAHDKVLQLANAGAAFNHVISECNSVVQLGDQVAARLLIYSHDGLGLLDCCVLDVGHLHVPILR